MYEEHPVLFIITLGVVAAKVTNKLVVRIYWLLSVSIIPFMLLIRTRTIMYDHFFYQINTLIY